MSETINEFGFEWEVTSGLSDNMHNIHRFINQEIGEFVITHDAFDTLKCIPDSEKYKVLALVYEQKLHGNIYSISTKDENVQWNDYKYISLNVDGFLHKFPSDFIEIQQRSLLNMYYQYPEYGQKIEHISAYKFFAKNKTELFFILESMAKKNWIDSKVKELVGGNSTLTKAPVITDDGWLEIERTIKKNRKKQVFIAMKFKDMDSAYKAIYSAIDETSFSPLRIDKKEHINQISSEIQYEISQSGLVIADVTGQNQGVYYEAGYAMGLNIPVIWTCDDKEKDNVHFDIRQYNTIFWKDENELHERLKKRIIAVMGLRENDH